MNNNNRSALSTECLDVNAVSYKPKLVAQGMLAPFCLVAILFPLWGFANDLTNPLVKAFKDIFLISNAQSSMVQFAFYLGYGIMAIPAALFIRRFTYKSGILLGLALYAFGALLFLPASWYVEFNYFLVSLSIMTCGLALLETTANPYILSMGDPKTATRRLNLAQSFNPLGSLVGMFVASTAVLSQLQTEQFRQQERSLHPEYLDMLPSIVDEKINHAWQQFAISDTVSFHAMQMADLVTVRMPYVFIALVVAAIFIIMLFVKLPKTINDDQPLTRAGLSSTVRRLLGNQIYVEGVIAQAFYVGAQIMCWTFIIHYGMTTLGLSAAEAQGYNIIAMVFFLSSRFICTFLLGYLAPGVLLLLAGSGAVVMTLGTIFLQGMSGLYCLVGISACMSTMFPTIYSIALNGMEDDASLASAGLIMAIVGGALMPPLQGMMIDLPPLIGNIASVKTSFFVPLFCFLVIALYAYRSHQKLMVNK